MEQIAGVDTRSLQWSGKADLWAACRSGPLLDSLCRLKNDGSVDIRIPGPFNEEIKRFEVSPDGRRILWTSLDVLGTFRVRTLDIGAGEIGRATCRERVWQYVSTAGVAVSL